MKAMTLWIRCGKALFILATTFATAAAPLPALRVSENHRFLVTTEGKPFFWLADTAWQLIHDLDEAETRRYLADRRDKGFTVIQTVALAEHRFDQPNAFGHLPIESKRPDRPLAQDGPDNDYWDDVERVLRMAGEHQLYIGLLPTWGKYVTTSWQSGLVDGFFTVANAEAYGRFIGARFKDHANLIWILGGDKAAPTDEARANLAGHGAGHCGSVERPWRGIARANALDLNPGDRLLFRAGQTFTGNLTLSQEDAGTSNAPVVITTWGGGQARIDAGQGTGVWVRDAGGVVVENLHIAGAGRDANHGGGWEGGVVCHNTIITAPDRRENCGLHLIHAGKLPGVTLANNLVVSRGATPLLNGKAHPDLRVLGNAWWAADGKAQFRFDGKSYESLAELRTVTGVEQLGDRATGFEGNPGLETLDLPPEWIAAAGSPKADRHRFSALQTGRLRSNTSLAGKALPWSTIAPGYPKPSVDFYRQPVNSKPFPGAGSGGD